MRRCQEGIVVAMDDTRPIRILCMEDDPGTARLFQKKLESLGYAVDVAENGQAGLAMYDAAPYDVVTVDQHMPIYDGLQVIEFLAQRDPLPPTIMITGGGDENLAVEAMKLGAGDYLVKDVNNGYLDLVPVVIEQLLEQRRLIRERQQATAAIKTQIRRLSLLNQLGQGLSETLNVEQIVRQLLHAAAEIVGADASS